MFNRFRDQIQRVLSPATRPTGSGDRVAKRKVDAVEMEMEEMEGPRRARRAAALKNLDETVDGSRETDDKVVYPEISSQEPPSTPQEQAATPKNPPPTPKTTAPRSKESAFRATLAGDGSIELPSGEKLNITASLSPPIFKSSPLERNRRPYSHNLSMTPVWQLERLRRPYAFSSSSTSSPLKFSGPASKDTKDSPEERYTLFKSDHKRTPKLSLDVTDSDARPHKRRKSSDSTPSVSSHSSLPTRSTSPTPRVQDRTAHTTSSSQRVRSIPENELNINRTRHEDAENDPSMPKGKAGRRVWSANDVLDALHNGRASTAGPEKAVTTPPTSPILSPSTVQGSKYKLKSPELRAPSARRQPLDNITDDFVPEFVRPTSPEPQKAAEEPPSPGKTFGVYSASSDDADEVDEPIGRRPSVGKTFRCPSLTPTVDEDFDATGLGLDGAAEVPESDHKSVTTGLFDLHDAEEDGLPKEPNLMHVLKGLDSDAQYIEDCLKQVRALRRNVSKLQKKREEADAQLHEDEDVDQAKAKELKAQKLKQAKAWEAAAKRADEEANEYRRKAKMILDNAREEAGMIRGLEDE